MTLDNMTGITEGSYTGFCKSQLITCNRVKECNGVCPFEDALKHADKEMDKLTVIDHDRDWIIGCIEHDGFIHTHRFDKANQIILDALSAEAVQGWISCSERLPSEDGRYLVTYPLLRWQNNWINLMHYGKPSMPNCEVKGKCFYVSDDEWGDVVYDNIIAWMPLPEPYREEKQNG